MDAVGVIAIEGPSASGKTSLARTVGRALGGVVVEEAYRQWRNPPPLTWSSERELLRLERRLLEAESRRWGKVLRLARAGRGVVMDTGPLGPLTYTYGLVHERGASPATLRSVGRLASSLARAGALGVPGLTIYLDVPATERSRRARLTPNEHPPELVDRHRRVGRWERRLWMERWRGRVAVERVRVAPGSSVSEVTREIVRACRGQLAASRGVDEEDRRALLDLVRSITPSRATPGRRAPSLRRRDGRSRPANVSGPRPRRSRYRRSAR